MADRTPYRQDQELAVLDVLNMPSVVCNTCQAAEQCTEFQENMKCAFDEAMEGLTTRDLTNLTPQMEVIADIHMKRAQRAYLLEVLTAGGQLDPNTTRQLEVAAQAAMRVAQLKAPVAQAASRSIAIVAQETGGPAQGGGLIAALMSKISGPAKPSGELDLNPNGPKLVEIDQ